MNKIYNLLLLLFLFLNYCFSLEYKICNESEVTIGNWKKKIDVFWGDEKSSILSIYLKVIPDKIQNENILIIESIKPGISRIGCGNGVSSHLSLYYSSMIDDGMKLKLKFTKGNVDNIEMPIYVMFNSDSAEIKLNERQKLSYKIINQL